MGQLVVQTRREDNDRVSDQNDGDGDDDEIGSGDHDLLGMVVHLRNHRKLQLVIRLVELMEEA